MPDVWVRDAVIADRPAVLEVVRQAFSDDVRDGREEIDIVESTWARGVSVRPIELVADDGGPVGHVLAAAGTVDRTPLLAVAPLGVVPSHQREGVGSALMHELIRRATEAGWPAVVLLGNPAYYGRFGFGPAAAAGIHYEAVGVGNPHFMIRILDETPLPSGSFTYCWEAGS